MTESVWVDTDMGVDDLFAILALEAHRPVAGLSLSFGCAPLPRAVENAYGAAQTFGWSFPIVAAATRPLLGEVETAERILGPRGLPSRGATLPVGAGNPSPALPALADWIAAGGDSILALGPLTNLATLALARPDLTLPPITWMGGSLGPGNHTAHAEFNALADPLALSILLERGARLRMIDLEACRQVQITETDIVRLAASAHPHAALLADLLGGYLDIGLARGRPSMALYDPVAAAALVAPHLFTFTPTSLAVDLAGDTRGRTRTDPTGETHSETVQSLDSDAIRTWCLSALHTAQAAK